MQELIKGVDEGRICDIMELILILTDLKKGGFFVEEIRMITGLEKRRKWKILI